VDNPPVTDRTSSCIKGSTAGPEPGAALDTSAPIRSMVTLMPGECMGPERATLVPGECMGPMAPTHRAR
jgi:hypothetical protein